MRRIQLSPQRRDLIAAVSLLALLLIALPLLGSLLANWFAPNPVGSQVALNTTGTPTASLTTPVTPAAQATATATLSPTPTTVPVTPLPTALARVYLIPFRQVFAIGSTQPTPVTPTLLYENGSDVFQVIDRQATFARLQTMDGRVSFWTDVINISQTPPQPPQYDFSVRGQTAQLANAAGLACVHEVNSSPPFSICQPLSNFSTATLTARIFSNANMLYLADIGSKTYFVLPGAGFTFS